MFVYLLEYINNNIAAGRVGTILLKRVIEIFVTFCLTILTKTEERNLKKFVDH